MRLRLTIGVLLALALSAGTAQAFWYNDKPIRRAYHEYCERMWNRGDLIGVYLASWSGC